MFSFVFKIPVGIPHLLSFMYSGDGVYPLSFDGYMPLEIIKHTFKTGALLEEEKDLLVKEFALADFSFSWSLDKVIYKAASILDTRNIDRVALSLAELVEKQTIKHLYKEVSNKISVLEGKGLSAEFFGGIAQKEQRGICSIKDSWSVLKHSLVSLDYDVLFPVSCPTNFKGVEAQTETGSFPSYQRAESLEVEGDRKRDKAISLLNDREVVRKEKVLGEGLDKLTVDKRNCKEGIILVGIDRREKKETSASVGGLKPKKKEAHKLIPLGKHTLISTERLSIGGLLKYLRTYVQNTDIEATGLTLSSQGANSPASDSQPLGKRQWIDMGGLVVDIKEKLKHSKMFTKQAGKIAKYKVLDKDKKKSITKRSSEGSEGSLLEGVKAPKEIFIEGGVLEGGKKEERQLSSPVNDLFKKDKKESSVLLEGRVPEKKESHVLVEGQIPEKKESHVLAEGESLQEKGVAPLKEASKEVQDCMDVEDTKEVKYSNSDSISMGKRNWEFKKGKEHDKIWLNPEVSELTKLADLRSHLLSTLVKDVTLWVKGAEGEIENLTNNLVEYLCEYFQRNKDNKHKNILVDIVYKLLPFIKEVNSDPEVGSLKEWKDKVLSILDTVKGKYIETQIEPYKEGKSLTKEANISFKSMLDFILFVEMLIESNRFFYAASRPITAIDDLISKLEEWLEVSEDVPVDYMYLLRWFKWWAGGSRDELNNKLEGYQTLINIKDKMVEYFESRWGERITVYGADNMFIYSTDQSIIDRVRGKKHGVAGSTNRKTRLQDYGIEEIPFSVTDLSLRKSLP